MEEKITNNPSKYKNISVSLVFVLVIAIFTIMSWLKEDTGFSENENRVLASKPEFTWESFFAGEYTTNYQNYVRDQFPFRNEFVSAKNYCDTILLKTEINGVLICEDDYYIESHERLDYESELAEKNMDAIASFSNRYVETMGQEHVSVMIVPTAQTVLTNKFKGFMYAYNQNEYIDKLKSNLPQNVFIDTYDVLSEHKNEYIYYRTDHHWTTYGAYLSYLEWARVKNYEQYTMNDIEENVVTDEFYGTINSKLNTNMKSDTISSYMVKDTEFELIYNMGAEVKNTFFFEEYIDSKDKYSYFFGGNPGLVEINSSNKNGKTLLIIKDSYANCIAPVYASNFETTYVIDLRYFNMIIDDFIEENEITDILVLYNVDSFATDNYIKRIR